MASVLGTMETELSLELLLAPSDNVSLMGTMCMSVGPAKLAPSGVLSMLLVMTGILGPEQPEPPSTTRTRRQPEVLCLLTGPESPDMLFGVVKLVLSDNACLMSVLS